MFVAALSLLMAEDDGVGEDGMPMTNQTSCRIRRCRVFPPELDAV
jgi:hypothetical protein